MRNILILFLLLFSTFTNAQTKDNPIAWETSIHKISETEYNVIFGFYEEKMIPVIKKLNQILDERRQKLD